VPTNFDERAATWDEDPSRVERAQAAAAAIRAAVPLGGAMRVLEYGAGTGLVSQLLAGEVGHLTLADTSGGMRAVMAGKIADGALPSETRIWALDLATDPVPDDRFDLLVTVMTLHHIRDLQPVLEGFATMLSPGGHLCVVDLEAEDGSFHDNDPDFEGHDGLGRGDLTRRLEAAGFDDVRFARCHEITKNGGVYPLFLATCRRP
jgi:ubiquinone/menaquinone biosynthesis C-methylase UbiE